MSRQLEIAMAIRKAYQSEGYVGVQLLLPFEVSKASICKQANRMGVKSEFVRKPKTERAPAYQSDPMTSLLRGWYDQFLTVEGPLAWLP